MSIDRSEVERIASLARLSLEAGELEALTADLSSILGHMDELGEAELDGVAAMGGVSEHPAPMRADIEGADPLQRGPSDFAPAWEERLFVVPRLAALDSDPGSRDGER